MYQKDLLSKNSFGTKENRTNQLTSNSHSFFLKNKGRILGILASGLISCGGGEIPPEENNTNSPSSSRAQKMAASVSVNTVPTSAPFEVDGMMGYGYIYFEHPINGYAQGPYINPFQTNTYNPRDILTKLGTTEWIIVRASFSYNIDKNNDGKADETWTSINAPMSMIVHRSVLEKGEKIIFSPQGAFISESLLTRSGKQISQEALDSIARESINEDRNTDGVINYSDVIGKKWSSQTTQTPSLPGFSKYMESVYVNNGVNRGNALKTLIKMQNHSILKIVANPSSHDPMLKIETSSPASILYTLDGTTPLPGGTSTFTGSSGMVVPLQDKRIYFREYIPTGTEPLLGKVKSFDLASDWMELSQEGQKFNPTGKESIEETSFSYNTKNYSIRSISNKSSPGYTYPKFLDCQVGTNLTDGCHLGPYVAYNEIHEAKIRELIHKAAQEYINQNASPPTSSPTPTNPGTSPGSIPTHYQNEVINFTGKINYLGGWYQVQSQWNLSGKSDFPVTIIGTYATPDGIRQPNIVSTANNESERLSFSQAMVGKLKAIIEAKTTNLPKPTYAQNSIIASNPIGYKGYTYTLLTTMNTTGYSDFPASVKVKYTTSAGTKETPSLPAKDATELSIVQAERINEAKSQIDISLGLDEYAPNQVIILVPRKYYGGGNYLTTFTFSGITGKDYPGYIDVHYRRSDSSEGKWTMQVKSETERNLFIPQGEAQAKLEIDNYPLRPINQIINTGNIAYGTKGGTYTRYEKYNRTGTGYNFPALVWIEYRPTNTSPLLDTRNTYGLTEAKNSEHLRELVATLEAWVKGQFMAQGTPDTPIKIAQNNRNQILDILIPKAYAADTPNSIVIKQNPTKLTSLSPYRTDVSFFRTYNIGNPTVEFFMKPGFAALSGKSKVNVVGKSEEEVRVKGIKRQIESTIAKIDDYMKRLPGDSLRCSGMGLLAQEKCINEQYPGIEGILRDRQEAIDEFNKVLKQDTLSMEEGIQFVVDMFNNTGEILGEKKKQLGLKDPNYDGTINLIFAETVSSKNKTNFKFNTRLPIIAVSGDRVIRGVIIDGVPITAAELGNLSVGFLGGMSGFTLEHILENSRNVNMLTFIKQGYPLSHSLNLAKINEVSDSILYKSGYEFRNIGRNLTKRDILSMFQKYQKEYKELSESEELRINKYKTDNGLS